MIDISLVSVCSEYVHLVQVLEAGTGYHRDRLHNSSWFQESTLNLYRNEKKLKTA